MNLQEILLNSKAILLKDQIENFQIQINFIKSIKTQYGKHTYVIIKKIMNIFIVIFN